MIHAVNTKVLIYFDMASSKPIKYDKVKTDYHYGLILWPYALYSLGGGILRSGLNSTQFLVHFVCLLATLTIIYSCTAQSISELALVTALAVWPAYSDSLLFIIIALIKQEDIVN